MADADDPAAARRRIVRREVWEWAAGLGWPALRVALLCVALAIAVAFAYWQSVEPQGERAPSTDVLALAAWYGLVAASAPALWVGLSTLAWRLAGAWAVVPFASMPLAVGYSVYASWAALRDRARELVDAVNGCLDARGLAMVTDVLLGGDAASPLTVPRVFAEAGEAFFDPPARVAMAALASELWTAIAMGLVPAAILSGIALAIGYRSGFERRHELDLARIRKRRSPR